jgi:hypothetical protein
MAAASRRLRRSMRHPVHIGIVARGFAARWDGGVGISLGIVYGSEEARRCLPRIGRAVKARAGSRRVCGPRWPPGSIAVYALRQASRRSWRIGQARPVEVYFAVYEGTVQAGALSLVGRKLRAALLVEGELPQEGLATQERDDGDLLLTLAKRLAAGERADA